MTKAKSVFPTDDSLLNMLYLAMMDITKKWTGWRQDWSLIHTQMAIYLAERMPEPFPKKRTRKFAKKQNESLSFWEMFVQAA